MIDPSSTRISNVRNSLTSTAKKIGKKVKDQASSIMGGKVIPGKDQIKPRPDTIMSGNVLPPKVKPKKKGALITAIVGLAAGVIAAIKGLIEKHKANSAEKEKE